VSKLSPLKAIRKFCVDCSNSSYEVKLCPANDCPLWPLRSGKGIKGVSPLKIIRRKCYDCGEGTAFDIKNCQFSDCSLYHYRFGKNPALKGKRGKGNPDFRQTLTLFKQKHQNRAL